MFEVVVEVFYFVDEVKLGVGNHKNIVEVVKEAFPESAENRPWFPVLVNVFPH